jgi:UDP-GlcNAc:undecaprenyl-phosphate GlcNAc-1-phosphate transferase
MWVVGSATFLIAFAISLVGTGLMCWWAPRWGLVDYPAQRKVHHVPTPLGGGVAIWAAVMGTIGVAYLVAAGLRLGWFHPAWFPPMVQTHVAGMISRAGMVALVLGIGTVQMGLGLVDDRRGLNYGFRLGVEIVLVLVLVTQGVRLDLAWPVDSIWASAVLTVVWVVGLTNAFNFLDNMDGLSSGVAWISCGLFCVVNALVGDLFIAGFLLVLMGALAGFLVFNWPPARIFMGDAGSNFVGYLIGVVTVLSTFTKPGMPEITVAAPLCVLAVPWYDSLSVILIRLHQGRSPFQPDKSHFSHRLVAMGMTPKQAVLTIYLITLVTGLGALMLYSIEGLWALLVLLQVTCMLGAVAILEAAAGRR